MKSQSQTFENMNPGDIYAMLWDEYLLANATFDHRLSELKKMEFSAFNGNKHAWCAGISGQGIDLLEMARSMTLNLVNLAVDTFTPDGSEGLKIDSDEYLRRYVDDPCLAVDGGRIMQARRFNPKAVWDALVEKYGGEQGAEAVYRQAAEGILHLFGIRNNPEIERRKQGVALHLRVYLDSLDQKYGENRLHWNCRWDVDKVLLHLKTFAVWSQDDTGMPGGIVGMQHHFADSRTLLVSRQRFPIGREIKVITYHSRFEFLFSHALAEKLQIFLGLYGTVEKNAA